MRKTALVFAISCLFAAALGAQEHFSDRLTAEEREAAGLNQLTPAQLDKLNELVQRDHAVSATTAVAPATSAAASTTAPTESAAPATVAQASAPVAGPAKSEEAPARKRRFFGLPVRDETNAITGVLDGEFKGWTGTSMFRLKDGEIWVQEDKTDWRQVSPIQNPRVTISKSMFGGYKMTFEGVAGWVRVRRIQ